MTDANGEIAEPIPDISKLLCRVVVEHPDEFIQQLTGITAPWVAAHGVIRPWFRGVAKLSYSLEPSLLRYRGQGIDLLSLSRNMSNEFRSWGARFGLPTDPLELHTVMQHHGVPTRLLDWTENAFAGLFFAVREHRHLNDPEDAIVWILDPLRLSEIRGFPRTIAFSNGQLLDVANLPLPTFPVHHTARVTAQRGTFTVHPFSPQHSLMKVALAEVARGNASPLMGIRIRGSKRGFIREGLLSAFGHGEFTFFPDMDGLARELRIRYGLEGKG